MTQYCIRQIRTRLLNEAARTAARLRRLRTPCRPHGNGDLCRAGLVRTHTGLMLPIVFGLAFGGRLPSSLYCFPRGWECRSGRLGVLLVGPNAAALDDGPHPLGEVISLRCAPCQSSPWKDGRPHH
jgi:hypothetical protein